MKPEYPDWNLAEKSRTDRDLKWDENCFVLFHFLNWYEIFQLFRIKWNGIDNFILNAQKKSYQTKEWELRNVLKILPLLYKEHQEDRDG